jgi:ATP/maltotriose-dependent transcriptional regulator MalT
MLQACRGHHQQALEKFSMAERLRSQLDGSHALASQVMGWLLATQARLGRSDEARALLATLDDERAGSGEIRNARAVICLAEGDPNEIASELSISPNTVNTHLRRIYAKLGVRDRSSAVRRARALRLLAADRTR